MKRLLIISNLFWVLAFGIFYFFYCKPLVKSPNTKTCDEFCSNYSNEPFDGLTAQVASILADNYAYNYQEIDPLTQQRQIKDGKRKMVFGETKSVWFSLATMKKFIYQIERNTCKLSCDSVKSNDLGIRFYFAKYPDSTTVANQLNRATSRDTTFNFLTKSNMAGFYGRKTLFMVPTYKHPILGDVDFDPKWTIDKTDTKCRPKTMKEILSANELILSTLRVAAWTPDSDPNGMQNHSPLCPPFDCPGQSF